MAIPFKQAKFYYQGRAGAAVRLIVIHTAECAEVATAAENVASYFAAPMGADGRPLPPQKGGSSHYTVDSDSVVQCVREEDRAWHAGDANGFSIGIELAGRAGQTPAQWADEYSLATLRNAAALVADIASRYGIPLERVDVPGLREKRSGITGHAECAMALGGDHWDPGPSFPWPQFLAMVREAAGVEDVGETVTLPEVTIMGVDTSAWVQVELDGVTWAVAPDYVAPVSMVAAEMHAAAAGCELPSPALVDAIWRAADLRVLPLPRGERGTDMALPSTLADQARRLRDQLGGRTYLLLSGTHKDVVRSENGTVGIYGWHVGDGEEYTATPLHAAATPGLGARIVQPFFAGHLPTHLDSSQGLRLCRRLT
jgi:N-acetyl-anhydromuramyl-L-alanine amidase AmpD